MIRHVGNHLRAIACLVLLLVVAASACAPLAREDPTAPPPPTTPPTELTTAPAGGQPGDVIALAMEALAGSLDLDTVAVSLISLERRDFPDAALGCPQPGEMAATVITPGYMIVLSASGAIYELHTNLNGTLVRCLPAAKPVVDIPQLGTEEPAATQEPMATQASPMATANPTPDDDVHGAEIDLLASALKHKDYTQLLDAMSGNFWMGFYGSEAVTVTSDEAIEKLQTLYLEPGLVRAYRDVSVEKLLPDWVSSAPYARFVYSTGWGESQKDDAILLFEERGEDLHWAGLFYIFEGLKKTAYGEQMAQLPPPPGQNLSLIIDAIESKSYETLKSLLTTPAFLGFHNSEASPLSPDAFVETLQRDYLGPGQVKVRLDVNVNQILPDWSVEPPCVDLLYSTGWGEDQADDGILCLRDDSGGTRWAGMLYIYSHLKETAYAEPPPGDEETVDVEGMIHIPAGAFIMGSTASEIGTVQAQCQGSPDCSAGQLEDETPQRQVTLDGFYIDETEVTVSRFKAFVEASGYQTTSEAKGDAIQYTWRAFDTPDRQDHPVRWMTWHDANAYCQWAGKRLPTEAEWERSARGEEGLIYPWGNVWDDARVPHDDTAPVMAFPNGASPDGVLGMAGGVWEWVADWYDAYYYQHGPTSNPPGPEQTRDKVLRGGAFDNAPWKHRAAHRHYGGADGYSHDHGFRCARDE